MKLFLAVGAVLLSGISLCAQEIIPAPVFNPAPTIEEDLSSNLPNRFIFTGLSYVTLESGKPEAGYAGFGQRLTDKAGGLFLLSGWTITSKSSTAESGVMKPVLKLGSLSVALVGSAGVVNEGQAYLTDDNTIDNGSTTGLSWSGGTILTVPVHTVTSAIKLPWKFDKLQFFFGGQVLKQNVGTGGIEIGGQKVRIAFGIGRDWSQTK